MVLKKVIFSVIALLGTITSVSAISPAPAPAPFQPINVVHHSATSIGIFFAVIVGGVFLFIGILLYIVAAINTYEDRIQEKKRAERRAIANFDKDLAFSDIDV